MALCVMDLTLHEVNPFFWVASVSFILLGVDALHWGFMNILSPNKEHLKFIVKNK